MYRRIMVPVDLTAKDKLDKAIETAAALARLWDATIDLVGVTANTPTSIAHNPEEFAQKLGAFAEERGSALGVSFGHRAVTCHDPAVDLDETLEQTADEIGTDLIVVGSHQPGLAEHIMASNAGHMASHAHCSVFVVR